MQASEVADAGAGASQGPRPGAAVSGGGYPSFWFQCCLGFRILLGLTALALLTVLAVVMAGEERSIHELQEQDG